MERGDIKPASPSPSKTLSVLVATAIHLELVRRENDPTSIVGVGVARGENFSGNRKKKKKKKRRCGAEVNSNEKLSLLKVASMIENSAKSGAETSDLRGKLMDQIEWLPTSIGKLSSTTELDLSENKIIALPPTISNLKSVTKLDLHSNQLMNFPDSFGELINITDLDLHANNLKSLPPSIGNLKNMVNLDLSSNHFTSLPN
ncbi:unnamed protein product [Linum tenue]|uniref:Uncharacterized protein n=1 Tax=Linum tenue TaxID=586396 RepID=A0AAV0HB58_9ROSI|nr:unnamed protein product [Linum tenue]